MKLALLLLLPALVITQPVSAQQASRAQVGHSQRLGPAIFAKVTLHRRASHWKTGAVVGAALGLGVMALSVGAAGDGGSASISEVFVLGSMGILLGGVPGALIGGLFPK